MKRMGSVLCFVVLLLLSGCGETTQRLTTTPPPTTTPSPGASSVAGNWQFNTLAGSSTPALGIAGSLTQIGNTVHGDLHVDGFNCLDPLTTIPVSGFVRGGKLELTSLSVNGDVLTLSGMYMSASFSGTLAVTGSCGDGERDTISGLQLASISGTLDGVFTNAAQKTFNVVAQVNQGTGSTDGSFALSGTATFDTPCFSGGTITSKGFPSASFILGTAVTLEMATQNGLIRFTGTLDRTTGEIDGHYTVSGGTCDDAGKAKLTNPNPWNY